VKKGITNKRISVLTRYEKTHEKVIVLVEELAKSITVVPGLATEIWHGESVKSV
jgi:hypothetical protein